jgi:outer membrane lipoprotein-sorting protein
MNRRAVLLALPSLAFAANAVAKPAGFTQMLAPPKALSDADKAALAKVSAYLNTIRTMKGGFLQIGPDGQVDQGTFALSKPGRIRFEYAPPTPSLIVSDGTTLAVSNPKLRTVDRYPLADTPLDLILGQTIDLANNKAVTGIEQQQDQLVVNARWKTHGTHADIALAFAAPELELRQWTVIDNQGLSTTVALRNTQTNVDMPGSLFVLPDKNPFARKQGE